MESPHAAQGGPNANEDKPEAQDLSRRSARVKNRLLQPYDERQAEGQAFTVLRRSRCNGESAAQWRRQGITQCGQARFAHPSQGLEGGSSQALSAGTRRNPIRKKARRRRGRMEASQLAMTGPRRPLVKIALQGGRCKLGNGPSHVSFGVGGSLAVDEQCGGRGKRRQNSHPARGQSQHGRMNAASSGQSHTGFRSRGGHRRKVHRRRGDRLRPSARVQARSRSGGCTRHGRQKVRRQGTPRERRGRQGRRHGRRRERESRRGHRDPHGRGGWCRAGANLGKTPRAISRVGATICPTTRASNRTRRNHRGMRGCMRRSSRGDHLESTDRKGARLRGRRGRHRMQRRR